MQAARAVLSSPWIQCRMLCGGGSTVSLISVRSVVDLRWPFGASGSSLPRTIKIKKSPTVIYGCGASAFSGLCEAAVTRYCQLDATGAALG